MFLSRNWTVWILGFFFLSLTLTACLSRPERIPKTHRPPAVYSLPKEQKSPVELLTKYAPLIGFGTGDSLNYSLYAFIEDWMGVPHRFGGATKHGIDCSGFVHQLFAVVYNKTLARSSYEMAENIRQKTEKELKEGDLVFFSFGKQKVDHVGLYLGNHKFIHVSTSQGVVISDLTDSWYSDYFIRAGSMN